MAVRLDENTRDLEDKLYQVERKAADALRVQQRIRNAEDDIGLLHERVAELTRLASAPMRNPTAAARFQSKAGESLARATELAELVENMKHAARHAEVAVMRARKALNSRIRRIDEVGPRRGGDGGFS